MPTNVNDNIQELSPAQRKKVEVRAAQLIAEEMTLRQLRQARMLTQVRMAQALGNTQDSVSRLERRSDLLLSTLRKTVEAVGGNRRCPLFRTPHDFDPARMAAASRAGAGSNLAYACK